MPDLDPLAVVTEITGAVANDSELAKHLPAVLAEVYVADPATNGPTREALNASVQMVGIATSSADAYNTCLAALVKLEDSVGTIHAAGAIARAEITSFPLSTTKSTTAQGLHAFVGQVRMTLRRNPA